MTTQFPDPINDGSTTIEPTAHRVTPEPARPFASVLRAGASAVLSGAEAAAHRLPGGPLVSAALRPDGSYSGEPTAGLDATGRPLVSEFQAQVDPMQAAVQAQAESSLYFLQLQHRIQEENRTYSTLSNVLKARHETVKNAIGNIR